MELASSFAVAIVHLYGSYLQGDPGISRVALARVLDGNWLEALGQGELARRGVADFSSHMVGLMPGVLRFLDERVPHGSVARGSADETLVAGEPHALVVDAAVWADASALAQHAAATVGGTWLAVADKMSGAAVEAAALDARLAGAGLIVAGSDVAVVRQVAGLDQLAIVAVVDAALATAAGLRIL
jgi:hypothetical protein